MQEPWELHWRDYYYLLGLRPNVEPEAVEGATKQLLAKYHPDKSGTGDAERFKPINEAREVLTDPARRQRYDAEYERRALKQKQSHRPSTLFYCRLADGSVQVKAGQHASPTSTISTRTSDYLDMRNGKWGMGMLMAFMRGKLKITGDRGAALVFGPLFMDHFVDDPEMTSVQQAIDRLADRFSKMTSSAKDLDTDAGSPQDTVIQFDLSD